MLNRFRDFVKRLELPQEDGDVVYRIIDDDLNAVEVTESQYARWRLQHDVARMAVVGEDSVENIRVRTTFSIMPENRNYKPFGTSAFDMATLDPRLEYSRRYDTWEDAEKGHKGILELISRDMARSRAADDRAEALAGVAGEVRLAISAFLPSLYHVEAQADDWASVVTPMSRADGSSIELSVTVQDHGFTLRGAIESSPSNSILTLGRLRSDQVHRLCDSLGVTVDSDSLACWTDDASHLGASIIRLSQALACLTYMAHMRR